MDSACSVNEMIHHPPPPLFFFLLITVFRQYKWAVKWNAVQHWHLTLAGSGLLSDPLTARQTGSANPLSQRLFLNLLMTPLIKLYVVTILNNSVNKLSCQQISMCVNTFWCLFYLHQSRQGYVSKSLSHNAFLVRHKDQITAKKQYPLMAMPGIQIKFLSFKTSGS